VNKGLNKSINKSKSMHRSKEVSLMEENIVENEEDEEKVLVKL
jgi:hypothetical protein